MQRFEIPKDTYLYGQLLLACKFKDDSERAKVFFKELLESSEIPSSFCHSVFCEIVGDDIYEQFLKKYNKKDMY